FLLKGRNSLDRRKLQRGQILVAATATECGQRLQRVYSARRHAEHQNDAVDECRRDICAGDNAPSPTLEECETCGPEKQERPQHHIDTRRQKGSRHEDRGREKTEAEDLLYRFHPCACARKRASAKRGEGNERQSLADAERKERGSAKRDIGSLRDIDKRACKWRRNARADDQHGRKAENGSRPLRACPLLAMGTSPRRNRADP